MSDCNFTQFIDPSECVGDSLIKINNNFTSLDDIVCSLISASPTVANIRLSFDIQNAVSLRDRTGVNASVLYVHPYKGTTISLYNILTRRWELNQITSRLAFPLTGLAANANFDIFLYREPNLTYRVEFVIWPNSGVGIAAPTKFFKDGVAVKSATELNKRYVGCLRTVAVGQSEQTIGSHVNGGSNTKQFLWNAQNQVPISVYSFESGTYNAVGSSNGWTGWQRVNATGPNGGKNHRLSFITGDFLNLDITGQIYISYYANLTQTVAYTAFGINDENNVWYRQGFQLISELRGSDMCPRCDIKRTFPSGYHFLQQFQNAYVGPNRTAIMNENHQNQTGYVATLIN